MKTKLKKVGYVFGIVISATALGTLLQFAKAWTEPTSAPQTVNIGAPITTGIDPQTKIGIFSAGGLVTKSLLVSGNAIIDGAGSGITFPDGTRQTSAAVDGKFGGIYVQTTNGSIFVSCDVANLQTGTCLCPTGFSPARIAYVSSGYEGKTNKTTYLCQK